MNTKKWLIGQFKRKYFNLITSDEAIQFLHVPKTGGTYIAQLESTDKPVIWPVKYLGHSLIKENNQIPEHWPCNAFKNDKIINKNSLSSAPIFTVVRNPFDWLVSYIGFAAGWNKNHLNKSHVDFQVANKGFEYALKYILERDKNTWPNKSFLFFPFFDSAGSWLPDWVLRNENLDEELKILSSRLNLKYTQKSPQKVGKRKDYRAYYDDGLIDLVNSVYQRELEMFGYSFDGTIPNANYVGNISEVLKKSTKYNHETDKLIYVK